jgi:hypothetical protein
VLAVAGAWLLASASLAGAEIIYAHGRAPGAELIAMNDDGSGAHVLLTPSQIPGSPSMINLADPNVAPAGTTLAFAAETFANHEINGPVSDCGANCEGIYTLAGGAIARLSPPPTPAVSSSTADDEPMVTADGRVVYETISIVYSKNCIPECEATNSSSGLNVRPIGGGEAQPWTLVSPLVTLPQAAADPVNGGLVAYVDGGSIDLANQSGSVTVGIAAAHAADPVFSPDAASSRTWTAKASPKAATRASTWSAPAAARRPKRFSSTPRRRNFPTRVTCTRSRGSAPAG